MTTINQIEVYNEDEMWYVKYTQNDVEMVSESFITQEEAITYSLNLKFI
jgi:hypothetical protein